MSDRQLLIRTRDPLVERRVARLATRLGLDRQAAAPPDQAGASAPAGLIVQLELEDAIDLLRAWRAAVPELPIVAFVTAADAVLWSEAEAAGADAVTTRGRADRELSALVEDHLSGRRRARRIRLAAYKDFAGRLGYVGRIDETPAGPIAIYQLGQRLYAVSDVCPHAGASLCEGELDGEVITCPRHGSQFRVTDGARVRGPADMGIHSFRVLVDGGEAFLEL